MVDAVVNRSELAMPPAVAAEVAKGFTLLYGEGCDERSGERVDGSRSNEPLALGVRHSDGRQSPSRNPIPP